MIKGRGKGLFAACAIEAGRVVTQYMGPVLTKKEAECAAERHKESTTYMVEFPLPGKSGQSRKDNKGFRM